MYACSHRFQLRSSPYIRGSNLFTHPPLPAEARTDAAECDTQFYKLFVSVILPLEDIGQRVIDTVLYRCRLFGLYFYI